MFRIINIRLVVCLLLTLHSYAAADVIDSLKSALNLSRGKKKIETLIRLIEKTEISRPAEALNYANEALKLLDINPDKELEAEVLFHKGWTYNQLNNIDSAKFYLRILEQESSQSNYGKGKVLSYLLSARILRTEGLFEKALEALQKAEKENENAGEIKLDVKILNEKGSVYRRLSRYDEAINMHLKALDHLNELKDNDELTSTYTLLGIVSDLKGNYNDALDYHHKALELNKKDNDLRGIAASNHNLGILYQKIEKYEQALEYYGNALSYWEDAGDKNGLASTLNSLGAVNELTGNHQKALGYYEQALEIWKEMEKKYSIAIALNNIGSIYEYLGNNKKALEYLREAINIRQSLGDKNGMAGSLAVLADIYNNLKMKDSAIINAKKGIEIAKEIGSITAMREGYSVLSFIYESNGMYKEALEEYKNYKMMNDTIFNSESRQAFAEMQEKYKSEEQKQQIELLKKESEIQVLYTTILIAGIILILIISILLYNRYRLKQKAADLRTEAAETKAAILQIEYEQKKKELEGARELQLSMLPAKLPEHPKYDIAALMLTATEVGGDYYDFHCDEEGTLTIALGDATGHGAQAGLMVTAAKSLFNLLSIKKDISEILSLATVSIRKMNFPNIFMALGLLRFKDDTLELAVAGLAPAYIYRCRTREIEEVPLKGLPLGSKYDFNYEKVSVKLNSGDVVLSLSDGFPELFNNKDEMMGFEKIPLLLKEVGRKSPDEIINHFTETATHWLDGNKQQDDMTFVVVKVK